VVLKLNLTTFFILFIFKKGKQGHGGRGEDKREAGQRNSEVGGKRFKELCPSARGEGMRPDI
jgi:hypothetical protein